MTGLFLLFNAPPQGQVQEPKQRPGSLLLFVLLQVPVRVHSQHPVCMFRRGQRQVRVRELKQRLGCGLLFAQHRVLASVRLRLLGMLFVCDPHPGRVLVPEQQHILRFCFAQQPDLVPVQRLLYG